MHQSETEDGAIDTHGGKNLQASCHGARKIKISIGVYGTGGSERNSPVKHFLNVPPTTEIASVTLALTFRRLSWRLGVLEASFSLIYYRNGV